MDKVGAGASAICAVHCLLTGVALSLLSALGIGFLDSPIVDVVFIATAVSVGGMALRHGISHHGSYVPAIFYILGLISILVGHFAFGHGSKATPAGTWASVFGGLFIVGFHYLNFRLQKANGGCGCSNH